MLKKYNEKRNFDKTREPVGKLAKKSKKLRYVIQHHMASREHYDLRLEHRGALLSWAVPKGPSFNPKDKRLAVMVEDHPLSYRNFEGVIPLGQYGGGTVMIWDEGYWIPYGKPSEDLLNGLIKFQIEGERLKGAWALVKMKDNNWLLIKEKDEHSKDTIATSKYKTSIRSGKTMKEIANGK